jgi:ABC-type nitrate/sulfonate/bicarbonate transport system ATPase subunit
MEMKTKIEVTDLNKSFHSKVGEQEVIKQISFQVYENEFLVILGPGGCGKTTLLKIMAGQLEKNFGQITFQGKENIGFVFQNFSIFPWMTVWQNVEYGLKMRNSSKDESQASVKKYIDLVGLTGFEDYYPKQISGGMKQRVGVARMLAISPEIMLMDNPLGHLDAQTRYQLQDELLRIWDVENKTVVFVTNDVEEAIYLADRILLLSNLPAEIKNQWEVGFERRNSDGNLIRRNRTGDEFLDLRKTISEVF